MSAAHLIRQLADTGIRLSLRGDRLHVEAKPGTVTPSVRALLENRKADLISELGGMRGRLLALAEAEGIDPGIVHRLPESEIAAIADQCPGIEPKDGGQGRKRAIAYLRALATTAVMQAGRLPDGFDTPALCRRCGPVWLPRAQVAMLEVVNGWPRALGCPWCFVRLPGGRRIPRPRVACAQCRHYQPDPINPQGMGRCEIDANNGGTNWPHEERTCKSFEPGGGA
ncbi:MAG TPA: hypothetical protein VFL96_02895 [Acidobacteriaceae bacterium]|nr:hypothetical protein [Acidobacteriaceae bacterium]